MLDHNWLRWVKRPQAIAHDGLTYAADEYDAGRYEQVREVAAEILAARSTGELEDARGLLELERGPATPKVDVRAAVFDGDRILLVKEPDDGGWSLPGGSLSLAFFSGQLLARLVLLLRFLVLAA